jgi:hypothetical protein
MIMTYILHLCVKHCKKVTKKSSKALSSTRESKEATPAENVEEIEVLETTVDTDPGIPTCFIKFKLFYCTPVDELQVYSLTNMAFNAITFCCIKTGPS